MTTTGYGDLTPLTRTGHALAVLEMLIGQIYLVTVIGLLVGGLTVAPHPHRVPRTPPTLEIRRLSADYRDMRRGLPRLSLTQQVALLSLIPILALGFVLARVLQAQIVTRAVADASQSAQLLARISIQPQLTPADLRNGLSPAEVQAMDRQLSARSATRDLARIKIWNTHHEIIYSDDHALIGHVVRPVMTCSTRSPAGPTMGRL